MRVTPMADTELNASQRALLAIREAKNKIKTLESYRSEPIAVIGMGCRFPGGDTPDAFWSLLSRGDSAICDIPPDRFSGAELYEKQAGTPGKIYIRQGGFLENVDQFDPYFFRISPREAEGMDPQQRLSLEVAWEALQHAGQDHASLNGSPTGVFMGMGQNDYARLKLYNGDLSGIDAYDGSGNLSCFAAGRLGYTLGTHGPNLVVDTACSSSLVAVHLACQSLRQRECDMALAGGVHLVLSPEITVFLCRTGVLSPDGRCKTFDAAADGFARGEGCGILVLKRLSDARTADDTILAVIPGSALNHDGRSGGLTVPNETAQADVIRKACKNAGITPDEISYIEAHGTGTSLGDPIEVAGLASVFGGGRSRELVVGSVKTNIGHLEAAAGVAGMIKTILALHHGIIPPHLNFKTPNPHINWDALPMTVPQVPCPWPDDMPRKIAGVSSFGMSGTNAHVLLESSPLPASPTRRNTIKPGFRRERYWVEPRSESPEKAQNPAVSTNHPLIGGRLRLPQSDETRFEAILTSTTPAYVKEHLVFGKTVVPAASHLTAVLTAVIKTYGQPSIILEDIVFSHPLILETGENRIVQIIFRAPENKTTPFTMVSSGNGDAWMEHVTGRLRRSGERRKDTAPPQEFMSIPETDAHETISQTSFYRHLASAGFDLGPSFQWGDAFQTTASTATCRLRPKLPDTQAANYPIHPGFLDTCFQLLSTFWETTPEHLAQSPYLFVPFSIDTFTFHKEQEQGLSHRCRATCLENEKNGGNLQLEDENGIPVLHVRGFRFRRADKTAFMQKPTTSKIGIYHQAWHPSTDDPILNTPTRTLLVFADEKTHDLMNAPLLRGHTAIRVLQANAFKQLSSHEYHMNPAKPEHFEKLFKTISEIHGSIHQSVDQLLCLWGMTENDGTPGSEETCSDAALLQHGGCSAVLHLLQALLKRDWPSMPPLNIVTNTGWALDEDQIRPVPVSAPIWGMARSAMREYPDFPLRLVDLDPLGEEYHAQCIDSILRSDAPPKQTAFRKGQRMDAGLTEQQGEIPAMDTPMITPDATYLITGGFGGLGLSLARMLVDKGCRRMVLCGRSVPSGDVKKTIASLENRGVTIICKTVDIADRNRTSELLDAIDNDTAPLRGIFHAAGIVKDALLLNLNPDDLDRVMAPKIMGAWHLHTLTRSRRLDHFVMFSSMASLFGSPGQANYAGANSFMDALAHFRRALGMPALSVNWGPFRDVGMAARLDSDKGAAWQTMGAAPLSPETGMKMLFQLMGGNAVQAGIMAGDSTAMTRLFHAHGNREDHEKTLDASPGSKTPSNAGQTVDASQLMNKLKKAKAEDSKKILFEHIKKRVAETLKLPSMDRILPRKPLFDAGLDSMMAVALKKQLERDLGRKLRTTLIFDYPTVDALVAFLHENILNHENNESPGAPEPEPNTKAADSVLSTVGTMSDDDVLAALKGR